MNYLSFKAESFSQYVRNKKGLKFIFSLLGSQVMFFGKREERKREEWNTAMELFLIGVGQGV
jgi:hypothetical protein